MKKDLRALGLIAGKKKSKQMLNVGFIATVLFVIVLIYLKM